MAKELSPNEVERELGDVCPRECAGVMVEPVHKERWKGYVACDVCRRHFAKRYRIPASLEDKEGIESPIFLPDEIVMAFIEATHHHEMAVMLPNPKERMDADPDWFKALSPKNQQSWIDEKRATLGAVWPMIAEWFGAAPDQAGVMRKKNAVTALQEVAIPSLEYCEEKYGFDSQVRVNLEAAIKE